MLRLSVFALLFTLAILDGFHSVYSTGMDKGLETFFFLLFIEREINVSIYLNKSKFVFTYTSAFCPE